MSARAGRRGGLRTVAALAVLGALAIGCDSSDDDDGGSTDPGMTDSGMTDSGTTDSGTTDGGDGMTGGGMGAGDGTFAEILGRGPTDEPVDFDAAALSADLEAVFGTAADDAVDVTDGDDVDDVDGSDADVTTGSRRRAAAY